MVTCAYAQASRRVGLITGYQLDPYRCLSTTSGKTPDTGKYIRDLEGETFLLYFGGYRLTSEGVFSLNFVAQRASSTKRTVPEGALFSFPNEVPCQTPSSFLYT